VAREAGLPVGTQVTFGRLVFTVVGLTEGIVSNAGDPVAFVSLQDGQEIQFLKANEAVRNDRARLDSAVQSTPALRDVSAEALGPITQNTHLANAILVRLDPGANAGEVASRIERWNYYRALTEAEQEQVLAESVIDRGRRQTLLFRAILLVVSIIAVSIDNVVRPVLIRKGADLPLVMIFAGVIGGLVAFGILGLFIGPVVLAVSYTLLKTWVLGDGREGEAAEGD